MFLTDIQFQTKFQRQKEVNFNEMMAIDGIWHNLKEGLSWTWSWHVFDVILILKMPCYNAQFDYLDYWLIDYWSPSYKVNQSE